MALEPISSAAPVEGDRVPFVEGASTGARFLERGGARFVESGSIEAWFQPGPVVIVPVVVEGVPGELIVLPSIFPVEVGRASFVGAGLAGPEYEHVVEITLPRPCNLRALGVTTDEGPGVGEAFAYMVRKNQGDTSLSGSMTAAQRSAVLEGSTVAYAKGDRMCVRVTPTAGAVRTHHRFVPDIEWL